MKEGVETLFSEPTSVGLGRVEHCRLRISKRAI